MDRFAASMIARGPTFGTDRRTVTGSLHVVGLPSVDAVHEFVAREPNNRAGVYAEHSVWRFENLLGRTMWEFPGASDEPKFMLAFVTAHRLWLMDTAFGLVRAPTRIREVIHGVGFTAAGRRVVVIGAKHSFVFDAATGRRL